MKGTINELCNWCMPHINQISTQYRGADSIKFPLTVGYHQEKVTAHGWRKGCEANDTEDKFKQQLDIHPKTHYLRTTIIQINKLINYLSGKTESKQILCTLWIWKKKHSLSTIGSTWERVSTKRQRISKWLYCQYMTQIVSRIGMRRDMIEIAMFSHQGYKC